MVELRQLQQILLLAEYKNFSKASKMAYISQPALSVSIKKAEEYFGCKLFNRKSKIVELTAQGELVVEMAKKMINSYEQGNIALSNMNNLEKGIVRLGVDPYLSSSLISPLIINMNKKYPGISFWINQCPYSRLLKDLRNGDIDFYLTPISCSADFPDKDLETIEIYVPMPVYYVRKGHPLTKLDIVSSELFENYKLVGYNVSPTYDNWLVNITNITGKRFFNEQFLTIINDINIAIDIVAETDAASANDIELLKPHIEMGKVVILENINWLIPHPENTGVIVTKKDTQLPPAAELMIKEIQEYSKRWEKAYTE